MKVFKITVYSIDWEGDGDAQYTLDELNHCTDGVECVGAVESVEVEDPENHPINQIDGQLKAYEELFK